MKISNLIQNGKQSKIACVCETQSEKVQSRRSLLKKTGGIILLLGTGSNGPAKAAANKIPSGFSIEQDKTDGYKFLYPNGWQAVTVTNEDVVYKDIIEPLESVSVTLAPTDKKTIKDYGELNEVAFTLADTVLTSPDQKVNLIATSEREVEGVVYYQFEFGVKTKYYERHALATVTIGNDRFYALVTGANNRRWKKMEGKLKTVIKSFQLIKPDIDV